jgi:hypothetical protein
MTPLLKKKIHPCILCEKCPEDNSKEHIILNALGGRKKIKGFLCNSCNNKTGSNWDSFLAESLKDLSLYFCITREKGTDKLYKYFKTTNGKEVLLRGDGSFAMPTKHNPLSPDQSTGEFSIEARDKKDAKQVLQNLKKKYPKLDIESCLHNIVHAKTPFQENIIFSIENFGCDKAGRSLVKSALGLVFDAGICPTVCEKAIKYLKSEDDNTEICWNYYYEKDLLINRPTNEIFHHVAVQGVPATGQLLGYIEFYSTIRIVVCLSNMYQGEEFHNSYSINPITSEKLDIKTDINFSREEIERKIFNTDNLEKIYMGLEEALKTALSVGWINNTTKEIINRFKSLNANRKAEEYFTIDDAEKISDLAIEVLFGECN